MSLLGFSDIMTKGIKGMMEKPKETADPSKWELTEYGLAAGEPA